jgi:hypothetical protein
MDMVGNGYCSLFSMQIIVGFNPFTLLLIFWPVRIVGLLVYLGRDVH